MEKQTIITATAFALAYAIPHAIFVAWYLYKVKVHVQKLHEKTARLHNQMRDTQAIVGETRHDLDLERMKTTRNY